MSKRTKGIIYIILSALLFALMNMFVKLSGDLPVFEKAFFRNAIAAIIALIVLLKNHSPMKPTVKGSLKFLILRTLFGLGGVLAGAAYGCVRKLGLMGENNPFIVFFFSAGSTLIITPIMIATYEPMELWQLGSLLMAGVCAALAQFSITAAYTCAPPKEISVYDFTQVIFTSLISIFVFSAVPDIYSFIGYIIIVSMALINYLLSNRKTS